MPWRNSLAVACLLTSLSVSGEFVNDLAAICTPLPSFGDAAFEELPDSVLQLLPDGARKRARDSPIGRPLAGTPLEGLIYGYYAKKKKLQQEQQGDKPEHDDDTRDTGNRAAGGGGGGPPAAAVPRPDVSRWRRVIRKAATGGNISVIVLGGSLSSGQILEGVTLKIRGQRTRPCFFLPIAFSLGGLRDGRLL